MKGAIASNRESTDIDFTPGFPSSVIDVLA